MIKIYFCLLGFISFSLIASDNPSASSLPYTQEQKDAITSNYIRLLARLELPPHEIIQLTVEKLTARVWPSEKSSTVTALTFYINHEVVQEYMDIVRNAVESSDSSLLNVFRDPTVSERFMNRARADRLQRRANLSSGRKNKLKGFLDMKKNTVLLCVLMSFVFQVSMTSELELDEKRFIFSAQQLGLDLVAAAMWSDDQIKKLPYPGCSSTNPMSLEYWKALQETLIVTRSTEFMRRKLEDVRANPLRIYELQETAGKILTRAELSQKARAMRRR